MIKLRNIKKSFTRPDQSRLEVLKGIDCEVRRGDFAAIVGPSGSGKSTLMNILGLLDQPDEGEYALAGEVVSGLGSTDLAGLRNRRIGFVFQQFHLLPRTTAIENVELPLIYSDADRPQQRAVDSLCSVGLEDRLDHYPSQLSGGQQQRVAIAGRWSPIRNWCWLMSRPATWIRIRPRRSWSLLLDLNRTGRTILLITHDLEIAARCSTVLRIDDGRLIEELAA